MRVARQEPRAGELEADMGPSLRRRGGGPIRALLFLFMSVMTAAPCAAEWRRLDSPNFIVIGDVSGNTLRDIAVKFEGFRETLGRVLSSQVTATAVPTVVVVFPSDRAFKPFMPKFEGRTVEVDGLFVPGHDVNYIGVNSSGGDEALSIVFHEYAHLMMSNVARNLPTWLGEGLAEYYSTYQVVDSKKAKLGMAVRSHIAELRDTTLLPLEQLLNVTHASPLYNEGSRRSVFYAQSWALTHMLLLGQPSRAQQFSTYLSTLGTGVPAMEAWKQVFDSKAITEALQQYVRLGAFYYREYVFSEKLAALDAKPLPLAPADAEAFLSDFLLGQRRTAEALERLGKAPGAGPGTPWSATVAALVDIANKDYAAAQKRLFAVGDDADWFAAYRAGAGIVDIAEDLREPPTSGQLAASRRLFAATRSAGREIPNATARLVTIELARSEPPPASLRVAIERARLMAPGRPDYAFLHARVLAELGEYPSARSALAPLMAPAYSQEIREAARSLMGYIVQREKIAAEMARLGDRPSADAAPPAPGDVGNAGGSAGASAGAFRPVFRPIEKGEERLEGVLERIECAKTGVTLHVRTGDGLVPVTSPDMKTVEFITYREDLSGSVGCGAVKGAPKVFVTWRADGPGKRAVAVEFLPQ
jgi:hypothetical protein